VRVVYLDQMKWIELAQTIHHGGDGEAQAIVEFIRVAKAVGETRYPLSLGHYIETNKQHDDERQARLGEVMFDLSDGYTLAALGTILQHELDVALSLRFPGRVDVRPLEVVQSGLSNAAGRAVRVNLEPLRSRMLPGAFEPIDAFVQREAHKSVLTGRAPFGTAPPLPQEALASARAFGKHLVEFRERFAVEDAATQHRGLYAMSMNDIWNELVEALDRSKIGIDEFGALGLDGYMEFMDALPSRRVDIHLHRLWLANPQLRPDPKHTDLIDWAYVATAAMYCDVVVTENRLAHLLNRGGLKKRAVVVTDLRDLLTN